MGDTNKAFRQSVFSVPDKRLTAMYSKFFIFAIVAAVAVEAAVIPVESNWNNGRFIGAAYEPMANGLGMDGVLAEEGINLFPGSPGSIGFMGTGPNVGIPNVNILPPTNVVSAVTTSPAVNVISSVRRPMNFVGPVSGPGPINFVPPMNSYRCICAPMRRPCNCIRPIGCNPCSMFERQF